MDFRTLEQYRIQIVPAACLADYTTFRLGGTCPVLLSCQSPYQLIKTVKFLRSQKLDFILIGGGSNIIISDEGLSCPVIRYATDRLRARLDNDKVTVWASSFLDDLVAYLADQGRGGLNYISGIPGTVGGAITGNAGAFGKQIGEAVHSLKVLTPDNEIRTLSPADLTFSYRDSRLKTSGEILLSATFQLTPFDRDALLSERQDILEQRRQKHPQHKETPCAGSFFRNLEPTTLAGRRQAAGWFLDQCGAKEMTSGGAAVFAKHANIIINPGSATAGDVYALSRKMAAAVQEKFGIELAREVRFVGRLNGEGIANKFW